MLVEILIIFIKVGVIFVGLLTAIAYTTYFERKVVARIQNRIGPNMAGPFGLLQPIADAIKLLFKEEVRPGEANPFFYNFAPILSFVAACMALAVIPVGNFINIGGHRIELLISNINIGILFIFAATSLGVYGIVLAFW